MKKLLSFSLIIFVLASCASTGENLEPAPSAKGDSSMDDIVVRNIDGVEMTVDADAWTGDASIRKDVTPMQVSITNNSDRPVAVRYQNFALVSSDGLRFGAIPPYQVKGSVEKREMVSTYGSVDPGFTSNGFRVSPYYGGVYNGVGVYDGYGFNTYDNYYYDNSTTYWKNIKLPTEKMVRDAMPEGVLDPGGQIKGFLYFENVDAENVSRAAFKADLQLPMDKGGDKFGQISIPFKVKSGN